MKSAIYLASALANAQTMENYACSLRAANYKVVSKWHGAVKPGALDPESLIIRADILISNLNDIEEADLIIADTCYGIPCATFSEIGYAIALKKKVIWLQPASFTGVGRGTDSIRRTNIFDASPLVKIYEIAYPSVPSIECIDEFMAQ